MQMRTIQDTCNDNVCFFQIIAMQTSPPIKHEDKILEAIDQMRRRKARPDADRICNYLLRKVCFNSLINIYLVKSICFM